MGSDAERNRLGFWLGAAAQSNVDQGPDEAPPESDLATGSPRRADRAPARPWPLLPLTTFGVAFARDACEAPDP